MQKLASPVCISCIGIAKSHIVPLISLSLIQAQICSQLAIGDEKAGFSGIIIGVKSNFLFAAAA